MLDFESSLYFWYIWYVYPFAHYYVKPYIWLFVFKILRKDTFHQNFQMTSVNPLNRTLPTTWCILGQTKLKKKPQNCSSRWLSLTFWPMTPVFSWVWSQLLPLVKVGAISGAISPLLSAQTVGTPILMSVRFEVTGDPRVVLCLHLMFACKQRQFCAMCFISTLLNL